MYRENFGSNCNSCGVLGIKHPLVIVATAVILGIVNKEYSEPTRCTIFTLFPYKACTCFGLFLAHNQEANCIMWEWYNGTIHVSGPG
jgi:hypothetical protein